MRFYTCRTWLTKGLAAFGLGIGLVFLVIIAFGQSTGLSVLAAGPTLINNNITASQAWIVANSPYRVSTTTVSILNGAVLTIEPGGNGRV